MGDHVLKEKTLIIVQVTNHLQKQLKNMNMADPSQNELVYLCFLYLSSLDKHTDSKTGNVTLNPRVLVFSIQL